ncbi:TetR/AcrR family transcriptional regulator [Microbacterium karelineae]|uniref:TetR/AcrR family transcriptional regulator n=1 Tax=Microbacterium karelineae TaxID=2654283 RepID=UPI0012E9B4FB|nr:TetR family transcriptional regulator C-terminal domain-containing protein [Microbacterium karelineae]
MPKIVDRDARRLEIVDTYLRLVSSVGVGAVTTRALAQELGVATGSLWHYFRGFDEVLQRAFERIFEATNMRIAEAVDGRTGIDALCAMIEQVHPLDKTTNDEAGVVVSFWGRIPFRHSMSAVQAEVERQWHDQYRRHLSRAVDLGELTGDTPVDRIADALLALVTGVQVEHVMGTKIARPDRQWQIIETVIGSWLTQVGRAAARLDERTSAV